MDYLSLGLTIALGIVLASTVKYFIHDMRLYKIEDVTGTVLVIYSHPKNLLASIDRILKNPDYTNFALSDIKQI